MRGNKIGFVIGNDEKGLDYLSDYGVVCSDDGTCSEMKSMCDTEHVCVVFMIGVYSNCVANIAECYSEIDFYKVDNNREVPKDCDGLENVQVITQAEFEEVVKTCMEE